MPSAHSRWNPRRALDEIQQLEREVIHARAKLLQAVNVVVVRDDGGNGREQPGGGGDERFGNTRGYGAQRRGAGVAQSLESVNNAPHRSEQADERSYSPCSRQQRQAALQTGQ